VTAEHFLSTPAFDVEAQQIGGQMIVERWRQITGGGDLELAEADQTSVRTRSRDRHAHGAIEAPRREASNP
jgi:hypothetical protein